MNVRNCRRCGKIFNYVAGVPLCPMCREEMDKKFREVKEYIREHKGVGIQQVAEACDVEVSQIHQWLREDRLELVEGSGIVLLCENCGAAINSGRFCQKCKNSMANNLQQSIRKPQKEEPAVQKSTRDKDKMRFL